MPGRSAPNARKPYLDAEIALVYLIKRSAEADALLAKLLGRTPGAVSMARRWDEGAAFPPGAYNRIKRQFAKAQRLLGTSNRGKVKLG